MPCFTTPKQLYDTCHARHRMGASRRGTLSPCLCKILTRLNHFSLRLRPVALRPSCLTFGVTSACPMFATRWLTYLAGTGVSPAGIIDLARPHTPIILVVYAAIPLRRLPRLVHLLCFQIIFVEHVEVALKYCQYTSQ